MKRIFLLLMIFALLLCGCDGPVIPPSTEPPVAQIPETTVLSATEPRLVFVDVPSLEPMEIANPYDEILESTGFVHVLGSNDLGKKYDSLDSMMYCYIGESSVIELPLLNMTLTLPEGWLERVYVFQSVAITGEGRVWLLSRNVMEAYADSEGFRLSFEPGDIAANKLMYTDYIVSIGQRKKSIAPESWVGASEWETYLGENGAYLYFYGNVDTEDPNCSSIRLSRADLVAEIGQDGYDDLVGDLVVDKQRVMDMITIHETTDHSDEVESAFAVAAGFIENRDNVQYLRTDIDLLPGTTASLTEEARKQIQLDVNVFPPYTQTAKDYGREIVADTMDYTLEKTAYLSQVLMQETGYPREFRVRVELVFADVQEQYARLVVHEEIHFLGRDSWGESVTYRFGRLNEVFLYCHEGQWLVFDITTDDGFDAKYKYADFSAEAAIAAYEANK